MELGFRNFANVGRFRAARRFSKNYRAAIKNDPGFRLVAEQFDERLDEERIETVKVFYLLDNLCRLTRDLMKKGLKLEPALAERASDSQFDERLDEERIETTAFVTCL